MFDKSLNLNVVLTDYLVKRCFFVTATAQAHSQNVCFHCAVTLLQLFYYFSLLRSIQSGSFKYQESQTDRESDQFETIYKNLQAKLWLFKKSSVLCSC